MTSNDIIAATNRLLEDAGSHSWIDGQAGREAAIRLFAEFGETVAALEASGWTADRIQEHLRPSRQVFATSAFMRRCQEWPRGYAGDFETIEYLIAGVNHTEPGTIGWHFEELLLQSAVVRQHRNKLRLQSLEIGRALERNKAARVLSVACGGCLDWLPVLPSLEGFAGEIVLNDHEPAALELAERRLRTATTRLRLAPGNVLRVAKRLTRGPRFDLVVAGGLFDYLPDHAIAYLLGIISEDLLAPGGVLLFTNIAAGNPLRPLMEHGANWSLIERSEDQMHGLCSQAGILPSSVSMTREATGLTLITRIVQADSSMAIAGLLAGRLQFPQAVPA